MLAYALANQAPNECADWRRLDQENAEYLHPHARFGIALGIFYGPQPQDKLPPELLTPTILMRRPEDAFVQTAAKAR